MKHNIVPIINQYFSCHQAILATYASYQKREYDMIFADSWGFGYKKDECPFGSSLSPGYQNRRNILLENFHGIRINEEQYTGKESLKILIQTILPYSPIILFCDVFDCPWNISYRKNHIEHYILITSVDNDVNNFTVLDPYSTEKENIIHIDNVAPNNGCINSFIILPENKYQPEGYRVELENIVQHIKNSNFFLNIENFHNDFENRFEEIILTEYKDVYAIPLINNIRRIANQRFCFCIFLKKMADEKLLDCSMINIMENIAEKYSLLRMLSIKQIMKKKNNRECVEIINEIMNSEHEAYKKIKSYI